MKHTEEEILGALRVLQDTCQGVECDDCPLRNENDDSKYSYCYLMENQPDTYDIIDTFNQPPRRLFNN